MNLNPVAKPIFPVSLAPDNVVAELTAIMCRDTMGFIQNTLYAFALVNSKHFVKLCLHNARFKRTLQNTIYLHCYPLP